MFFLSTVMLFIHLVVISGERGYIKLYQNDLDG